MRVGYSDQNGHPYRSIGRVLIDRGEITLDRASMQGIREWGLRHPDQLPALLDENPSYVFFREVAAPPPGSLEAAIDGPLGALGVPLLAGRAVAVDTRSIALGAPVFLATTFPLSSSGPNDGGAACVSQNRRNEASKSRTLGLLAGYAGSTAAFSKQSRAGIL